MITRTVVATDGISPHVGEVDNGRPVVFVQELGYAAWAWRSQSQAVGRVARAVVMDNRGARRQRMRSGPCLWVTVWSRPGHNDEHEHQHHNG